MYVASMDVKTALHAAKPKHIENIMDSEDAHGWIVVMGSRGCAGYMVRRVLVYQASRLQRALESMETRCIPHSPRSSWHRRPIRVAITKYGSTWIVWSGAAVNLITKDTSDHSF